MNDTGNNVSKPTFWNDCYANDNTRIHKIRQTMKLNQIIN